MMMMIGRQCMCVRRERVLAGWLGGDLRDKTEQQSVAVAALID